MVVDTLIRDALKDLQFELRLFELFQDASFIFVVFHLLRLDFPEVRLGIEAYDRRNPIAAHRTGNKPQERIAPPFVGDCSDHEARHHGYEYVKFEWHESDCQISGPHDAPG